MTFALLALAVALVPPPLPRGAGRGLTRWGHGPGGATESDPGLAWILALAGELRAGSDALRALRTSARRHGTALYAARAARLGGDVEAALRRDAQVTPVLAQVAAAWAISQRTGAALADVLDHIADSHRRTVEVRRALAVELAGPRATAKLMSLLPLVGIGFAVMLGADPLGWFVSSWSGAGCLIAGLALNAAGFLWINRIVHGVEADL